MHPDFLVRSCLVQADGKIEVKDQYWLQAPEAGSSWAPLSAKGGGCLFAIISKDAFPPPSFSFPTPFAQA